jgi:hypothetical protein
MSMNRVSQGAERHWLNWRRGRSGVKIVNTGQPRVTNEDTVPSVTLHKDAWARNRAFHCGTGLHKSRIQGAQTVRIVLGKESCLVYGMEVSAIKRKLTSRIPGKIRRPGCYIFFLPIVLKLDLKQVYPLLQRLNCMELDQTRRA